MTQDSTLRFGERAQAYAAYRPSYPAAAIDAILAGMGDPQSLRAADIGAGTGIWALLLAERGVAVTAIERNAQMRECAQAHPLVDWRDATAQATGLPDASVDLVTSFQAFHWFATPAAMNEFRRIARRRAVSVQYEREERDPFTAACGEIIRRYALDETEALRLRGLETFARFPGVAVRRQKCAFGQSVDEAGLIGRAASASYLPQNGSACDAMREEMRACVRRFARDGMVTIRMCCFVLCADFRPSG